MCTLFAVLSQRWCCQINQSLYVHVICCPLTTLVLSDEAVSARHVFCSSRLAELPVVTAWWTTRVAKDVSDQGDQHNNGPHQIFDNPSALCLTMWATNQIRFGVGRIDSPDKLFMDGVGLVFFPLFPSSDWVSLRSSRSKYKASTINNFFLLLFSTLRAKTVWINLSYKKKKKKKKKKKMKQKIKEGRRSLLINCTAFFFSSFPPPFFHNDLPSVRVALSAGNIHPCCRRLPRGTRWFSVVSTGHRWAIQLAKLATGPGNQCNN